MQYVNKDLQGYAPQEVEAMQLKRPTCLAYVAQSTEPWSYEQGGAGDYLVTMPDGNQGIVKRETFLRVYRPKEQQGPGAMPVTPLFVDGYKHALESHPIPSRTIYVEASPGGGPVAPEMGRRFQYQLANGGWYSPPGA